MKEYFQKKFAILGIFFLVFLALEISTFMLAFGQMPKYFFFDLSMLFYIGAFLLVIGSPRVELILATIIEVVIAVICFVNANMIDATGEIFSWDMLSLIPEATKVLGRSFIEQYACGFLFLVIVFLGFMAKLQIVREKVFITNTKKRSIIEAHSFILLGCLILGFATSKIQVSSLNVYSNDLKNGDDKYLYETLYIKQEAYKKFGTLGYYSFSATSSILEKMEDKNKVRKEVGVYLEGAEDTTNFMTGVSEGNNVIYILFETGDFSAINKTIMPNLYSLLTGIEDKDGNVLPPALLLSEYYAKSQTNISEAQMLFGSYPLKGILNFDYDDNNYSFNLPTMYKENNPDSRVISYHNNLGTYYNRTVSHKHYGFDFHVAADEMTLTEGSSWINMDSEMFESCLESGSKWNGETPVMIPSDGSNFFTYIANFSTHGPFDERSEYYPKEYYEYVDDYFASLEGNSYIDFLGDEIDLSGELTPTEYVRTYLAGAYDFDLGLGMMFDELREKDLLESTTIVFMSDHYAYYQDYALTTKGYPIGTIAEPAIYRVPAIIFDTKLSTRLTSATETTLSHEGVINNSRLSYTKYNDDYFLTYNKFITNYDFCSTMLNILGFDYNERAYFGYDIFSKEESFVFSRWGGFFNNVFYTSDSITIENINDLYYDYARFEKKGRINETTTDDDLLAILEDENIQYKSFLTITEYRKLKVKVEAFVENASDFLTRIDMVNEMYRCDYFEQKSK